VQDISVFSEHVDLLNALDGLHVQLLQSTLQLFVVLRAGRLGLPHNFSSDSALAAWVRVFVRQLLVSTPISAVF
jgi:hypothetical protein